MFGTATIFAGVYVFLSADLIGARPNLPWYMMVRTCEGML